MSAAPKFEVGQTVLVSRTSRQWREPHPPDEVTVTKVGRTLVYVARPGRDQAFHIANGVERRGPNAGGMGDTLYTVEEWADSQRRSAVLRRLLEHDITAVGYGGLKQDTATLERVLAVLDEAAGSPR